MSPAAQPPAVREDIGFAEVMQRILGYATKKQSFRDKPYCMERDLVHIHREISEAFEAYRCCPEGDDWKAIAEVAVEVDGETLMKPEGVTVELADAVMRILEFCAYYELPLTEATERKLAFLETANLPPLHGKRF